MFINDLVKTLFLRHTSLPCPTLVHEKNSCKCTQKSEHDKTFHLLLMFFILSHKKATGKAIGNTPFHQQWELTQTLLRIHAENDGDKTKFVPNKNTDKSQRTWIQTEIMSFQPLNPRFGNTEPSPFALNVLKYLFSTILFRFN